MKDPDQPDHTQGSAPVPQSAPATQEVDTDYIRSWPRLIRSERLAIGLGVAVIVLVTLPRLPPGICFGDSGDLQLAARTLGIMHPPGYTGLVTIGFLTTLMPGVNPAYMITLGCLVSGVIALWLCMMLQVRLGVNAWVASAIVLALTATHRVWSNLITPEVYAPSLMFLVSAIYLLVKYGRLGRHRDLYFATLLFGMAVANRPTVVWSLPFFVAAWWMISNRLGDSLRASLRTLPLCILLVSLPGLYALGYLWVRDSPDTTFNYIELKRLEFEELPDARDGTEAKLQRLWWQATAREFKMYMGNSWHGVKNRFRWMKQEYFLYRPVLLGIVLLYCLFGVLLAFRRCKVSGILLIGVVVGNTIFICTYNIYGHAADLLPILFSASVLAGVATSVLIPRRCIGSRRTIAIAALTVAAVATIWDAPHRALRAPVDATGFLAELDMQTLPRDSMICSVWHHSTVLWYAQFTETDRDDILIVNTTPAHWRKWIEKNPQRPAFVAAKSASLRDYDQTPYRNIFRVERRP